MLEKCDTCEIDSAFRIVEVVDKEMLLRYQLEKNRRANISESLSKSLLYRNCRLIQGTMKERKKE